jgi:hypothetical protein
MNKQEDPLDALLHEQDIYIEDRGFTANVINSLPRRRSHVLRRFFLPVVATIGCILAMLWLPWNNLPAVNSSVIHSLDFQALLPWVTLSIVIASLVWSVIVAFQED